MRNRELIIRKLENVESNMSKLNFFLNSQRPIEEFKTVVNDTRDIISQIKDFIQIEPSTGNELNKVD